LEFTLKERNVAHDDNNDQGLHIGRDEKKERKSEKK
jgi:hypothetical protein